MRTKNTKNPHSIWSGDFLIQNKDCICANNPIYFRYIIFVPGFYYIMTRSCQKFQQFQKNSERRTGKVKYELRNIFRCSRKRIE